MCLSYFSRPLKLKLLSLAISTMCHYTNIVAGNPLGSPYYHMAKRTLPHFTETDKAVARYSRGYVGSLDPGKH